MRRDWALCLILVALLVFSARSPLFPFLRFDVVVAQSRIVVPDDYPTIQSAVDGADPGDVIFVRNGTYFENVVINKTLTVAGENSSSTIVDGNRSGSVFTVLANGVTIANFTIQRSGTAYPDSGIRMPGYSLVSWCVFKDNVLAYDFVGVLLSSAYGNLVERNRISGVNYGVYLLNSGSNKIFDNSIVSSYAGFVMFSSGTCQIIGNYVFNNTVAVTMYSCSGNIIYYNNFVNVYQTTLLTDFVLPNTWDSGYPSGGNYWSNYHGVDIYRGPYQNITGSDGIADSPYRIAANNTDNFPLMGPVSVFHDVGVLNVFASASRVHQGQTLNVSVVVANLGNYTETFDVSVSYVMGSTETQIDAEPVTNLLPHSQMTVTFVWNTLTVAKGNYTIKAQASPVEGEGNFANNIAYDGSVAIVELFHDVGVLNVFASASRVYQGQTLNVSVVVANLGDYTEIFNVTAFYEHSIVGQQNVPSLESGGNLTLVYSWNTAGVAPAEYSIGAEVTGVAGDANQANDVFVDSIVRVRSFALESVKVGELVPSDHMGNPLYSFSRGAISYFKVAVNSTSLESEIVLVTVNVYDSSSASLGVVSFKGLIMPGVSVFILGLPIPNATHTGTAMVYANTFTDWPFVGGIPYGSEKSAAFQILG